MKNKWLVTFLCTLCFLPGAFAQTYCCNPCERPVGWSVDVGGTYTWMSFSTPPTYSGSTGGIQGKLTYQAYNAPFGQARSFFNIGPLSSSLNDASLLEWYTELVAGYCCSSCGRWSVTPYVGVGIEFLYDHHSGFDSIAPIGLNYNLYYAVVGLETRYHWQDWLVALQVDALPTFKQYLQISTMSDAAWILENRTGAAVRLPIAYRYMCNYWIELAPYYRYFPVGKSEVLSLSHRNLQQWGAFLTFRFFL